MPACTLRRIAIHCLHSKYAERRKYITIDIFEHRLEPRAGYTVKDMADVVLGDIIFEAQDGNAAITAIRTSDWSEVGSDHPIGIFHPGAIQVVPNYLDPDAELIELDGTLVKFPDAPSAEIVGLFPNSVIVPHRRSVQNDRETIHAAFPHEPFKEILLGAILEATPLPYRNDADEHESFRNLERISGRIATLLDLGFAAGIQGRKRAMEQAVLLCRDMRLNWWLMPDQMRHPKALIPSPELRDCVPQCDKEMLEFGRLLMRNIPSALIGVATDAVITEDDEHASNHQRIGVKPALKELDRLIEDHAPIHLLKPAALKRREKRQNHRKDQK